MKFELNEQLKKDTELVCCLSLCQVRLLLDANYPWFLLIPMKDKVHEFTDLTQEEYLILQKESLLLLKAMQTAYKPDKMNVASLGNVVSQLHVHHIARYRNDRSWPAPVWGKFNPLPYDEKDKIKRIEKMRELLL